MRGYVRMTRAGLEVAGWLRANFTYSVPALYQNLIRSEKGVPYTCTKGVVFRDAVENSLKSKHEPWNPCNKVSCNSRAIRSRSPGAH
jgi:hypothetical protein